MILILSSEDDLSTIEIIRWLDFHDAYWIRIGLNTPLYLIYSIDSKFYFLEVNPMGQYDMVSVPCNYNLDYLIAN